MKLYYGVRKLRIGIKEDYNKKIKQAIHDKRYIKNVKFITFLDKR